MKIVCQKSKYVNMFPNNNILCFRSVRTSLLWNYTRHQIHVYKNKQFKSIVKAVFTRLLLLLPKNFPYCFWPTKNKATTFVVDGWGGVAGMRLGRVCIEHENNAISRWQKGLVRKWANCCLAISISPAAFSIQARRRREEENVCSDWVACVLFVT